MKIGVIGGAGVRTVIFINGLLKRYRQLNIDEVVLYDIDRAKQEVIGKLCEHVVARKGEVLHVRVAEEPIEAIKDSDYIVTTLRVGGDHSRVIDEETALRCGVIGQETTGVGGFSMAMRTIPILLDYCRIIKENAPNALIFNFTNPSGLVTQALHSAGYDKVIGICDAPSSCKFRTAKYLGIEEKQLYMEFYGLNHLSWISSVKADRDKKGFSSAKELLPELIADKNYLTTVQEFEGFDPELFTRIKCLPNEYLYYYYHRERALENMLKSEHLRGKAIEEINRKMFEELHGRDIDANPEAALQTFLYYMAERESSYMSVETGGTQRSHGERGELEVPDGMGYAGVMLDCIEGLQSDEGRYLVLSVPNRIGSGKCIDFLRPEDVVEVTCLVSSRGIEPVRTKEVPEDMEILIRTVKHYERLSVEAARTHSYETAVKALMLHPLINSYSLAVKLVDEYDCAYGGKLLGVDIH